jgi:tight adherence protein B
MVVGITALVFLGVMTLILGAWWIWQSSDRLRRRLGRSGDEPEDNLLLRAQAMASPLDVVAGRSSLLAQLTALAQQAGSRKSAGDLLLLLAAFAGIGAAIGGWRTGSAGGAVLAGIVTGFMPVSYFLYKRHRRLQRFQERFADAVDMISRSMRAGNALTSAIQLVGQEMADPIGQEFRQVAEEIRLGLDPTEALGGLKRRVPSEDVAFFCTAINIQRGAGGNLAEILDRLSDVIRKRFELLSHARVLSAQQRYAAIFVGCSPVAFSILFYFISPGYFDPLIESPSAPMLVGGGLVMQTIGFAVIWRMSRIKV